ncbi:MAG: hypothetical protein MUW57_22135 [Pseudomonas sp.]|nr:hypothetical protein [Pseudomonas sp.]
MVWQRSGTVSVQNGSTTVVGANVDFASSSRNGDSFVGPDGATYEVTNVASATVISILPAYKGATVSGAAYAIMPVQGYDKMLSDAFNALNNQFGSKLAALGTTGNYDILPLNKGGTGATDQPGARASLGLGSAALGTLSTSQLDGTANRVQKWGDWGLGTSDVPVASTVNITYSGFSRWDTSTAFYSNYGALSGSIISVGFPGEACSQIFIGRSAKTLCGFRSGDGGFYPFYHTGNTTRAADGTLKAI